MSALANVCSLKVRELPDKDYCMRINHCLPDDIRILAFSFVKDDFDARFDCKFREYKYLFFKGSMDIELIRSAAKKLLGLHDFRNFCKKDKNLKTVDGDDKDPADVCYLRTMYKFDIEFVQSNSDDDTLDVYMAVIKGSSFIWRQVRCMMAVLFMIGKQQEQETVID